MKYETLIEAANLYQAYLNKFKEIGYIKTNDLREQWYAFCATKRIDMDASIIMAEILEKHGGQIREEIAAVYAKYLNRFSKLCYDNNETKYANIALNLAEVVE